MVILNAVYTVVLVLLKDQWWYMWAVRAMNQEAFYLWAALLRTQVSEALVPLEERWTWINPPTNTQLRPSVQKLSLLLLLIFNSHPPILADPVQSRRIKVKVDMKRMKWTQNTDCDFSASDLRGTSGWSLSNSCATMLQCAAISYSLLAKSEYKSKQADVTFSLIQLLNSISSPSSPSPSYANVCCTECCKGGDVTGGRLHPPLIMYHLINTGMRQCYISHHQCWFTTNVTFQVLSFDIVFGFANFWNRQTSW